jgi:hypothetical protein
VLAKDKEFVAWRAEHGQSFVPRRTPRIRKRAAARDASPSGVPVNKPASSSAST